LLWVQEEEENRAAHYDAKPPNWTTGFNMRSLREEERRTPIKDSKMKCQQCDCEICPTRLEFLPDTKFCVNCADDNTQPLVARMIYSHKTAGELFVAQGSENIRRLEREYNRSR